MVTTTVTRLAQALRATRSRKAAMELTDAAVDRIKSLLSKRDKKYLKLGVKTRGCNGMAYTLNYADDKGKFDELVESQGVSILIDPGALMHVLGSRMDYVEDRIKSEFVFSNPNVSGTCGCGESFTTGTTSSDNSSSSSSGMKLQQQQQ
jgi:iron-sulfur cluster assembly 1